ncbi:hypothetical protein ACFWYW_29560 [Nonomuraea sp. NPDC059023]|uniref:hypothetical protein n=1 Tax=unclassified Nonomuraea TaxID=2593643 RepID=UPI0036C3A440
MKKLLNAVLISTALAGGLTTAVPLPASASADGKFHVCYKNSDCRMGFSQGEIHWSLPSSLPSISGSVYSRTNRSYSTTVVFEGFNDKDQKLTSDSRTVADGTKRFAFHLSRSWIYRVKITVCQNFADGQQCGSPKNYYR